MHSRNLNPQKERYTCSQPAPTWYITSAGDRDFLASLYHKNIKKLIAGRALNRTPLMKIKNCGF